MNLTRELKIFILCLSLIVLAEIVTTFVNPLYGIFIHSTLLFSLMALSAFWQKTDNTSNFFLCLSIAPLIRIFSLSLPLSYMPSYVWYIVAGVPMLIAAVTVIRIQALPLKNIGLTIKKPKIQFLIMLTGIPFGALEYFILKPSPMASGLTIADLVLLSVAFILATGFVEELVFRGVFQSSAIKMFGAKTGLIAVSAVFAALHIGWASLIDVVFVFLIGLFFGIIVYKTGSLAGVSLAHGLTNVLLFMILPSVNLISIMSHI
jgi:uncharacterized protein